MGAIVDSKVLFRFSPEINFTMSPDNIDFLYEIIRNVDIPENSNISVFSRINDLAIDGLDQNKIIKLGKIISIFEEPWTVTEDEYNGESLNELVLIYWHFGKLFSFDVYKKQSSSRNYIIDLHGIKKM